MLVFGALQFLKHVYVFIVDSVAYSVLCKKSHCRLVSSMNVFGVQISFQFLKLHTMTGLRLGTHFTKQSSEKENILKQIIFVLFNLNMAVLH